MRSRLVLLVILTLVTAVFAPAVRLEADEDPTRGMVMIPGGTFTMGRDTVEGAEPEPASPAHEVEVAPFYLARYEVTNREYARFIEAKGYTTKSLWSEEGWKWVQESKRGAPRDWEKLEKKLGESFPKHPVTGVNWFEADAYARWVGKRLPTEAEWEYAARGDTGWKFPWGNSEKPYTEETPKGSSNTHPVGAHAIDHSPLKVFDMGGNVSEWTASLYQPYPKTKYESRHWGKVRVARGGSWRFIGAGAWAKATTTYRSIQYSADKRGNSFIGFRLAMDIPQKK